MWNSAADVLIYSNNHHARFLSLAQTFVLCLVAFQAIDLFLQIDLPSSQESACTWSLKFCRISTEELLLLVINKTFFSFFLWLQQDICSLHSQREDSDCYRSGIQRICELLRIQITTSVNCSEEASSAKNGYWNESGEFQRDKKEEWAALLSPPVPTHPGLLRKSAGIIFHNDICCCSNITFTYFSFLKKIST